MLPMLAAASTATPPPGAVLHLASSLFEIRVAHTSSGWAPTDRAPTCTIAADDQALLLFVLGRAGAQANGLRVSGEMDLASRFKLYFPGP